MKQLIVSGGGHPLNGTIHISGSKNAALPIMISALLFKKPVIIKNIPNVADIETTIELLKSVGAIIHQLDCHTYSINAQKLNSYIAPYEIVKKMRASFLVLGALLSRFKKAKVSLPGGCSIGQRPVDIHIAAFEQMQTKIINEAGYINAQCINNKLCGADLALKFPSVGATQNIIIGAVLADGHTTIRNAAKEPEVIDLINFLNKAGAKITFSESGTIEIDGVDDLNEIEYTVMGDRIEAGTYMIAAAITNGDIVLDGLRFSDTLSNLIEVLKTIGLDVQTLSETSIRVDARGKIFKPTTIITSVYPGFPTDLQAQMMALLANINGQSIIDETIFENRFMHVPELNRMGAHITVKGSKAFIDGKKGCFFGVRVMASDLRAGASLVLASLAAKDGISCIDRYYHIERGYENLVDKFNGCGATLSIQNG